MLPASTSSDEREKLLKVRTGAAYSGSAGGSGSVSSKVFIEIVVELLYSTEPLKYLSVRVSSFVPEAKVSATSAIYPAFCCEEILI